MDEQHKTVRHSPPPPPPQPPTPQAPADEPALGNPAQTDQPAASDAGYGEESSGSGSLDSGSGGTTTASSSSGGSSNIAGLPIGAFVGVVAGATAAVAALAVLAAVVLSRRSKAHRAAAGTPAAAGSSAQPAHGAELGDPKVSTAVQRRMQGGSACCTSSMRQGCGFVIALCRRMGGFSPHPSACPIPFHPLPIFAPLQSPRARQHNIQLEASSHQEAPAHPHMM